MEIKYSYEPIDETIFGRSLIVGFYDKSNQYLETLIPYTKTIKKLNLKVNIELLLKTSRDNRNTLKELTSELEIGHLLKRNTKTLSTSELIKIQTLEAFLTKSTVIILKDVDTFLNHRDFIRLIKALKNHSYNLKKTVIICSTNIDNIIASSEKYIVVDEGKIIYNSHDYKQIPINSSIKNFVELANKKGAGLNSYKDESDLLKAIFRSVNRK